MTLVERLDAYEKLMRLDKPIGILLLLWPTLWGLWYAAYDVPDLDILAIFITGTVLMRSAGCIVNDYADRNFDPHVERTRNRPLAAGLIKPWEALALAGVLFLLALALVLQTNQLAVMLAFPALALAVIYPFVKRVFSFPQAWLGLAFGFGIPMGYAAQYGKLVPVVWLLLIANMFWAIAYDTEYAMVDREDDLKLGIRSTAILFAESDRAIIGGLQLLMLSNLVVIGQRAALAWPYYAGLAVAAALFAYQQYLIRDRSRAGCFAAFMNNNWVGGVIFAGLAACYPPLA
jgi:4-hydroxybenzoate polyprenyltransferase